MKEFKLSKSNPYAFSCCFLLMAIILMFPDTIWANIGFGQIGENVKTNSLGIAQAIQYLGYTVGLGCAVWGLIDLVMSGTGRSNATAAGGLKKLFIGAALLGVTAIISASSATLFGSDQTTGIRDLGL